MFDGADRLTGCGGFIMKLSFLFNKISKNKSVRAEPVEACPEASRRAGERPIRSKNRIARFLRQAQDERIRFRSFILWGIIIFSIIGVLAIIAGPLTLQTTKDCLPIVMILSDEDTGLYSASNANYEPMYNLLKDSIKSELSIIVSTPILYWLTKRTTEGRNPSFDWTHAVNQRYCVSISAGNKFALLLPQKYSDKLDFLGFNSDYLKPIAIKELKKFFADETLKKQEIDPAEFEKLFCKHSFRHPVCPKYFYIAGHGLDAITEPHFLRSQPVMAQMPIYNVVNMLQILNDVNTHMVYLLSCYAAGSNLVQFQNLLSGVSNDDRCQPIQSLNYPLIVQCTLDTASTRIAGKYFSLAGLFDAMIKWRQQETSDATAFAQNLGQLYAKAPADERFSNFPICRQPGSNSHFQALSLSQTTVIQNPVASKTTFEIPESVEMIQIYPRDARKITVHIKSTLLPTIMSRIPGPAHHFIGELNCEEKGNLNKIINSMFFNGLDADGQMYYGVADKGWFVQKVVSDGKTIAEGLVVYKGCLKQARAAMTAVYKGTDGNYYRLQSTLPLYSTPQHERIDEKTYLKTIGHIYWQTMPSQDALDEATNGMESLKNHENLFSEFCNALAIKATLSPKKELIEEDFVDLENEKLSKDDYINYATYLHDKEITESIVDATVAGKIFEPLDCLTLLVRLIADGHQDLALEQIHKIAQQNNSKALSIILDTLLNLVASDRHKLVENTKEDVLQCLKLNVADHQSSTKKIEKQLAKCTKDLIKNDHKQLATQFVNDIRHAENSELQAIASALESEIKTEAA